MNTHTHKFIVAAYIISAVYSATAFCAEPPTPATTTNVPASHVIQRDPFWPVNFYPVAEDKTNKTKHLMLIKKKTKWPKLKLKGLTKTGKNNYIAIIDQFGIVEPGDIISAKKDGLIYRWKINAITDKGISRTRLDVKESSAVLQKHQ